VKRRGRNGRWLSINWHYLLLHARERYVVAERLSPELLGVKYRAIEGRAGDGARLILRKLPIGARVVVGSRPENRPSELDYDELRATGLRTDEVVP
jgi:hypothetical protein